MTYIRFNRHSSDRIDIRTADEDGTLVATMFMGTDLIDAILLMQEEASKYRASGHYPPLESGTVLLSPKQMHDLKAVTDAASQRGNADANDYLHGMANGLILALAIVEGTTPEYIMRRPEPAYVSEAVHLNDEGLRAEAVAYQEGKNDMDAGLGKYHPDRSRQHTSEFQPIRTKEDLKPIQPEPAREYRHIDDIAVDALAVKMRDKLALKRRQGRGGWDNRDECSTAYLSRLIVNHVAKGDPVDVANLCAFLSYRGDRIDVDGSYKLLLDVFQVASKLAGTLNHTAERQEALDELRKLVS